MANKYEAEYRRARAQLKQNLSRMEKKGYDVSAISIPAIPERITKSSIERIRKVNESRYEKATKDIVVYDPSIGDVTTRTVSGKEGLHRSRSEASAATYQRRLKEAVEEANAMNAMAGIGGTILEINPISRKVIRELKDVPQKPIKSLNAVGLRHKDDEEIPNASAILEGEYQDYSSAGVDTPLSQAEIDDTIFHNALNDLIETSKWRGKSKTQREIKGNAKLIAEKLQEDYAKDPAGTAAVLRKMLNDDMAVDFAYLYDEYLPDGTNYEGVSRFEDRFNDLYEKYEQDLIDDIQDEIDEEYYE